MKDIMKNKGHSSRGMSRRDFMTVAGGAALLAAFGAGAGDGWCDSNVPKVDPGSVPVRENKTDVLVVGSGLAGVFAAVKAHDAGAGVLMISKGRLGASGQTPFARGVFAWDPETAKMSAAQFTQKVSRSALGTNNPVFTRQMAEHSLDRLHELMSWGFFDSPLYARSFSIPVNERNIPVMERVMLTHLIKENGRIAGAAGFSPDPGEIVFFRAKTVVLCTGAGGFKPSGFPICDLTHDGTCMAYDIGAKVTGKEWNDGHFSLAENPADVYGQWGGMLENPPTIEGVGVRHDLGMDMNYRAYVNGTAGRPGPLDHDGKATAGGPYRPAGFERPAPPHQGAAKGDSRPPRPRLGAIVGGASAGMSIHKAEGLVPFNDQGASNIPGLYAAGDALGSHMCGGIYTQIGSSTMGSAVQGAIAGKAAASEAKRLQLPGISTAVQKQVRTGILAPLKRPRGYSPAWVTRTLRNVLVPNFVLYIKKAPLMEAALAYVKELQAHHLPMLKAGDFHELRLAHETANMVLNAEMKLRASLMRKESRCSHFRLDYPEMDTENWNAWINIYKDASGKMVLEKQAFGTWPA